MPRLDYVEGQIERVEKFQVAFLKNGADLHGNKENIPSYPFSTAAKDNMTVAAWISTRFKQNYPGYDVRVFTHTGAVASGAMLLSTVRGK